MQPEWYGTRTDFWIGFRRRKIMRKMLISLLLVLTLAAGLVAAQDSSDLYNDPDGRFTIPIPTNWQAETTEDGYALLTDPDDKIKVYALVIEGEDVETAIQSGWEQIAPDFEFQSQQTFEPPSSPGVEKTVVMTQISDDQTQVYQGVGQLVKGQVYILLIDADITAATQRSAQITIIASGFKFTALTETDLSGQQPAAVDEVIIKELEAYIPGVLEKLEVPGAAVAIVQNGEIVYERGFGAREQGQDAPVTPDTRMMIGSTGKSLTTLMMATLVDAGLMQWDQKVIDILPAFAVADPEVTRQLTVRNLVCACTGVPRRDLEWLFNADSLTAENIVESLQTFRFFTDFGEAFQYSNQMVATGGYIATLAAGGEYGVLYEDYVGEMQQRVFDPIGMANTTFSFEAVESSDDYATPHGSTLVGEYLPIPISVEKVLMPVGPAGSVWSTAHDMARYMITELNRGVAPGGKRVVSEENLAETWKPQVAVSATASYGLGWFVDEYKGLRLIHHGGNTFGFTSDFAFLPDSNLGVVVMTNARASNAANEAIRMRLFELVFDQPNQTDEGIEFVLKIAEEQIGELKAQFQSFTQEEVEPYLGTFTSETLGEVTIAMTGNKLTVDAGEFVSELQKSVDENGKTVFLMLDPPVAGIGFEFQRDDGDNPILVIDIITDQYTFTKAG
jgi:CubicO group peptidase (beta-lactamase class C family)